VLTKMGLTAEMARMLLDYDPETGILRWKARSADWYEDDENMSAVGRSSSFNGRFAGKIAGSSKCRLGYRNLAIFNQKYLCHRIIFLIMTGDWPTCHIDHANRNTDDNRWSNLRPASRSENIANSKRRSTNTSGHKGVCWDKSRNKWRAEIKAHGKKQLLGRFNTFEEAVAAYSSAAFERFADFARPE
jgi:HNH endonuclease/AP2 domain